MLRILLIGPALLAATHAGGSYYAPDARQIVQKRPSLVYAGISNAIAGAPQRGIMQLEGGQPVPYRLEIERTYGERLVVNLILGGIEGAEVDLSLIPQGGGEATLMLAKVQTDGAVLRQALAGSAKAKLGYAPDWVFNLVIRQTLRDLAGQIEQYGRVADPTGGFITDADAELTPDERRQQSQWRQRAAARPTLDPSAEAQKALSAR